MFALFAMPPPDAVIVSVRLPRFADVLTLTVSVEEPPEVVG